MLLLTSMAVVMLSAVIISSWPDYYRYVHLVGRGGGGGGGLGMSSLTC